MPRLNQGRAAYFTPGTASGEVPSPSSVYITRGRNCRNLPYDRLH